VATPGLNAPAARFVSANCTPAHALRQSGVSETPETPTDRLALVGIAARGTHPFNELGSATKLAYPVSYGIRVFTFR
jgi:hypothetical protein